MTENTKLPNIIPDDEDYELYLDQWVVGEGLSYDIKHTNDILQYFSSWNHTHLQDEELANALNIVQKKLPATLKDWQEWAATIYHEGRE